MLTVSRATLGEGKISMTEAILEPELPIIDPHHHLWDSTSLVQQLPPDLFAKHAEGAWWEQLGALPAAARMI